MSYKLTVNTPLHDRLTPSSRIALIPPQRNKTLSYRDRGSSIDGYEPPEYDFAEIITAEDAESYFARTVEKKTNLMFKEGWSIISKDESIQAYINARMIQISHAQGKSWGQLLKEVGRDLHRFSNAILVKVRDEDASGGYPRSIYTRTGKKRTVKPVAAYFIVPLETVEFRKNTSGDVIGIRQVMPDGRKRTFSKDNIVHFYINKKSGWTAGTPGVTPVLDDIRTLRRIEENVDLLVYQNLFPLFQYSVGTAEMPAQIYPDGSTEVDVVRTQISYMPPEGVIVTPERHEIKLIGSEGRALRVETYLEYFKKRVFAGLGTSSVDHGEGSTVNKATASTLSAQLIDGVKSVQMDFAEQFNFFILNELLLEGIFSDDPLVPERAATLKFKEIDIDKKISLENHAADIYTKHLITETEARMMVGFEKLEPEDEDRQWSYVNLVETPKTLLAGATDSTSPLAHAASNNPMVPLEGGDVEAAKKAAEASKPAPAVSVPPKKVTPKKNTAMFGDRISMRDNLIRTGFTTLLKDIQYHLRLGSPENILDGVIQSWADDMKVRFSTLATTKFNDGVEAAGVQRWAHLFVDPIRKIESSINTVLNKISYDLSKQVHLIDLDKTNNLIAEIDITMNRVNAIYVTELSRAYNSGKFEGYKVLGVKTLHIRNDSAHVCDLCRDKMKLTLSTATATIESLPPHHPYCKCEVHA